MPRGLISYAARSAGLAGSRRGNQARGTPSVRPSFNSTHRLFSSQLTVLGEMQQRPVADRALADPGDFNRRQSTRGPRDSVQPGRPIRAIEERLGQVFQGLGFGDLLKQ